MKIDAYTKGVLTVIAACLVWMCVNSATPTTHAAGEAAGADAGRAGRHERRAGEDSAGDDRES